MEFKHVLPADIERTSMGIIQKELDEKGIVIPEENLAVVRRVIHTTADFDYAENLAFTEHAVERRRGGHEGGTGDHHGHQYGPFRHHQTDVG